MSKIYMLIILLFSFLMGSETFSLKDGSWGLIRASSNKPSLVVVTESPTSNERKNDNQNE